MIMHLCIKIKDVLSFSDAEFEKIGLTFYSDGEPVTDIKQIRRGLADELEKGNVYIPNVECDHFDPKIGCLGHSE